MQAERFMDELDNGVKLCRLAEILQSKIPKDCLPDKKRVSRLRHYHTDFSFFLSFYLVV